MAKKTSITLADLGEVMTPQGSFRKFVVVQQINLVRFIIGDRIEIDTATELIEDDSINVTIRKAKDSDF